MRLLAAVIVSLGCASSAPPPARVAASDPHAIERAPEPPSPRAESVEEALSRYAVDDDRPWRDTVYSWMRAERAAEVARTRSVLTGTARDGAPTPFSTLLFRLERRSGAIGRVARALLDAPTLRRHRYAWAFGWPTARGFQGERYGSALVRFTLRDDALVLRLDPDDERVFRLYDRAQRALPPESLEALLPRVGAVYHVRRAPSAPVPFREYIVCNPDALRSWSVATADVCAELDAERATVSRVLDRVAEVIPVSRVDACWRPSDGCGGDDLGRLWARAMATAATHYLPTRADLAALLEALRVCDTTTVIEAGAP